MTRFSTPEIDFEFYDDQLVRASSAAPLDFEDMDAELEDIKSTYEELVAEAGMRKPEWFLRAERQARAFVGSLCLTNIGRVYLLEENELMDEVGMRQPATAIAITDPYLKHVFVRNERLASLRLERPSVTAELLVHELVHSAADPPAKVAVHSSPKVDYPYKFRSGFGFSNGEGGGGLFFEEGLCEVIRGWFNRSRHNPLAPVIGVHGRPSPVLPDYLSLPDPSMTGGPDGYAMELLAWGLQKKRIMTANDFVANMLATRRTETLAPALRTHAQAIEALHPGLYVQLRNLSYSKENWQNACQQVYDVVTTQTLARSA